MDEPAGELDAESAAAVYSLLAEVTQVAGASALIVSHDAAAATIADGSSCARWMRGGGGGTGRGAGASSRAAAGSGCLGRAGSVTVERDGRVQRRELRAGEPAADGSGPAEAPAAATGEVVAELHGVNKAYGDRTVLDHFDLIVRRGRLIAIVGRSGTGKTTLLHLLAGLLRPTAGVVVVDGEVLWHSAPALAAPVKSDSA